MNREKIQDYISLYNPEALLLDPEYFDQAIVGTINNADGNSVVVYDVHKIIELLTDNEQITFQDAIEYYHYNIEGANMGKNSPVFMLPFIKYEEKLITPQQSLNKFDVMDV